MSNIYVTADSHFGHKNIAGKNISQWKDGYRNYQSVDEMNQDLVKSINQTVMADDTLYHLGDWSFGGIENIWKFRKQIACQNIHLILGNHDHHIEDNKLLPNCNYSPFGEVIDLISNEKVSYGGVEAQELFSSVSHYKEITINGKVFVLSHYPFAIWHGNGKGWYHLHGHCHGNFNSIGKSMDIGVDSANKILGKLRPFALIEITTILDKKDLDLLDHHNSNTNVGRKSR